MKVAIITPARDEEKYIKNSIECMLKQTVLPDIWVIVNDGSTDNTYSIVEKYLEKASFLKLVNVEDRGQRLPGSGVISTFYKGLEFFNNNEYDILAKFDADLEFPPNLIEQIKNAFHTNKKLGIAGGTLLEPAGKNGKFIEVLVPSEFVDGPNKFYRKQCFDDIGGLIFRAGWDGVDLIRANMKGWETVRLPGLYLNHMRIMGSSKGEGFVRANRKYGDVSYYMGGFFWYFLLRALGRSLEARTCMVGFQMCYGYFHSMLFTRQRESHDFRAYLKRKQLNNMRYWISFILRKMLYLFRKKR